MPTAGLSLIGFTDDPNQAINYLRKICVPSHDSDHALLSDWVAARQALGAPIFGAGKPEILPIPKEFEPHIEALVALPALANLMTGPLAGTTFQLVEIEKLLAFQLSIDSVRSEHHCSKLSKPPSMQELFETCLPLEPPNDQIQLVQLPQSALIKSRSLNLNVFAQGIFPGFAGLQFGFSLPFVHVVNHNGRYYLHNGFHRTYGAAIAGAKYIPCLLRNVTDHESVGIRGDGTTFSATLLESANPPTVGHYVLGRASSVQIRAFSRILHVSWSEYVLPDE